MNNTRDINCLSVGASYDAYVGSVLHDVNALLTSAQLIRPMGTGANMLFHQAGKDACKVVFTNMQIPDFTSIACEPNLGDTCTTAPQDKSYEGMKCSSIASLFSRSVNNIVISGCDLDCKVSMLNDMGNLLPTIMPQIVYKAFVRIEELFFTGLFKDYYGCGIDQQRTPNQTLPFFGLKGKMPSIYKVAGTGSMQSAYISTSLNVEMVAGASRRSISNRTMFVDPETFKNLSAKYGKEMLSCCSLFGGSFDGLYLQTLVDKVTGMRIMAIPTQYLGYDAVTHRPIFPIVDTRGYYVSVIPNGGIAGYRSMLPEITRQGMTSNYVALNNSYIPITLATFMNDHRTELAHYMSFYMQAGAIMANPYHVDYLLGDAESDNTRFEAEGFMKLDISKAVVKEFTIPTV